MAYPLEELQPGADENAIKEALMATVQQLISEGLSQEQAVQKAQEMFQSMSQQQPMPQNRTSTNMTSGEFIRGGSLTGSGGAASNSYQSVPNPRLNNINPASYPRGSV